MSGVIKNKDTSFDQCLKCTVCTVYCPVAQVNPIYPGPKQCGPDGERLRIKSPDFFDEALKYCTNCKRCEVACPSNVKIGDLIAVARAEQGELPKNPKLVRDFILSHTDLMGSVATPIAPVVNMMTGLKPVKYLMNKTIGISGHKELPKYSHGTFVRWYKKNAREEQAKFPRQVHYFHGCYVNYNNPDLGKEFVQVMNAMGIGVQIFDKEKCCGVPLIASGFHEKAKKNALINIDNFEKALDKLDAPILATSATCGMTLQQEYPHVLKVDNTKVVDKIEYITRWLLKAFMSGDMPKLKPLNLKVAYQTSCHMEVTGNRLFTLELLRMIPGIEVIEIDSQCCGSAGTYCFKEENYETSEKIGAQLFDNILNSGTDLVVTDCETCKWQVEEHTKMETIHPITLLARALA